MDKFEKIAMDIFRRYGLGFDNAERAGGWTNAVWLNCGYVLRLSKEKGGDRIRREVERAAYLPAEVGYPKIIGDGIDEDYEWSLSERKKGVALSIKWPDLSWPQKAAAVKQVIGIVNAVHSVDINTIEHITPRGAWYNPFIMEDSLTDIERYVSSGLFSHRQGRVLRYILEKFYTWNANAAPVLCHGDVTTDNLLWHEGSVTSLLDFEHSVIAPRQLDIHSVFNLAFVPYDEKKSADIALFNNESYEIQEYIDDLLPWFAPYLSSENDMDLFMGYNVLFRQRFFEFWLRNPEAGSDAEKCDAYQKLLSFSDGTNGYLQSALKRMADL